MAHRHDHDDHHHHHHHHHGDEKTPEMTFPEKMEKLLNHWIKHNREHVATYRNWADKASKEGMEEIGRMIGDAAAATEKVDVILQNALRRMTKDK